MRKKSIGFCLLLCMICLHGLGQLVIQSFLPTMARSTDTVTITGTNFLNVTTVRFGDAAASWFTVKDANTILALPGNGLSGSVIVQSSSATSSLQGFVYLTKPIINNFSPASTYSGQTVTINGKFLALPGVLPTVTLGGVPVTAVQVTSTTQTSLWVTVGSGATGYIKVSHLGGADSVGIFTYIKPPVVNSFYPLSAYPADTVSIFGKEFTGATNVYFGDSLASSFTVVNDTLIRAAVSHGKTGSVKVVKVSGSSSKSGFTFLPLPPPVISSYSPQEGITGITLNVQGEYLWGVIAAKVGNVPVRSYEQVNFGKLKLVVPINASGAISVKTYYGSYTLSQPLFVRVLPPVISSFSPISAVPGQQLTIIGQDFGTDLNNVAVNFGSVKAKVVSVEDTKIVVTVPVAAIYGFIQVTANGLTAFTAQQFTPLNPSIANLDLLTGNSFGYVTNLPGSIGNDRQTIPIDLNNDGKTDFVSLTSANGTLSYFLNTSTPGNPSWSAPKSIQLGNYIKQVETADVDGNGSIDIVMHSFYYAYTKIALNVSTADSVKFIYYTCPIPSESGHIADMNGDGKVDIVSKREDGSLSIILNNSIPGVANFSDTLTNFAFDIENYYWELVNITDLDKDGLMDLVGVYGNDVKVFRNTGTKFTPAFDSLPLAFKITGVQYESYYYPERAITGDMNGDGLPDLIVAHNAYNTASLAMYKNTSTPGKISFASFQLVKNIAVGVSYSLADFNGDNRPDIIVGEGTWTWVFQNKSTADSIILADKTYYKGGAGNPVGADVDGDNKQDIVTTSYGMVMYVIRNRMNETTLSQLCLNGSGVLESKITASGYQWQMNNGNGFSNITNDANFSGTTSTALTLNNIPTDWYKRQFRCLTNNVTYSETFSLTFANTWTGNVNSDWNTAGNWSCNVIPDGNTKVIIPSGKTVVLNEDGVCQSITLMPNASYSILSGKRLLITNN